MLFRSPTILVMMGYLAAAIVIFGHILLAPSVSHTRRVVAMLCDLGTVTWVMAFLGERAAPLFLLFVWITLANGFRFGQGYLLICLGLSAAGFGYVVSKTPYWQSIGGLGWGLLAGFVALSLYVRSLVTKLFDAIARAEAANLAKRRFISVVSHEMRTPLNVILGSTDILLDTTGLEGDLGAHLGRINSNAEKIGRAHV